MPKINGFTNFELKVRGLPIPVVVPPRNFYDVYSVYNPDSLNELLDWIKVWVEQGCIESHLFDSDSHRRLSSALESAFNWASNRINPQGNQLNWSGLYSNLSDGDIGAVLSQRGFTELLRWSELRERGELATTTNTRRSRH
jgi:hypothetical protein